MRSAAASDIRTAEYLLELVFTTATRTEVISTPVRTFNRFLHDLRPSPSHLMINKMFNQVRICIAAMALDSVSSRMLASSM